jgi:hypothetical protein
MSSPTLVIPVVQDSVVPDESALLEAIRQVKAAEPAFGISRISKELETRFPVSLSLFLCSIIVSGVYQVHTPTHFVLIPCFRCCT